MNANNLSLRLQTVADFVPQHARLADIGSDHAYLPIALTLSGVTDFAVAGEVVEGPYEAARAQVRKNGLTSQIAVRLADGLEAVDSADKITSITICGMGGVLIRDILQRGKEQQRLSGNERLILQPNIAEKQLRTWLVNEKYTLINEAIIQENNKIYEIIVAEKQAETPVYTTKELLMGPHLLQEKGAVFAEKWQRQLVKNKAVLASLLESESEVSEKIASLKEEIQWIKEALAHEGD